MVSAKAGTDSFSRVERICQTTLDVTTLRLALLDEIRRVVDFDVFAWLITDPETSVGSSPLANAPRLAELPRLIQLKYLTELNRWTGLTAPVALLHHVTDGDLSRSLLFRELLHRYDVRDVASVVFRDTFGCWGFLDLWRCAPLAPFTAAEEAYLAGIAPQVASALRRSQAHALTATGRPDRLRGPVVLLLSSDLAVLAQTPETDAYLRVLVPPNADRSPVPASAYNVAAQLLAIEAGVDINPPSARVHLSGGRLLTLRAAWIGDPHTDAGSARIAVTMEDSSPSDRAELFARAHGMTIRERELLSHLIGGSDTRELARAMFLSEHTVQDHLKSMFDKASVHSRRTLLSRALGT